MSNYQQIFAPAVAGLSCAPILAWKEAASAGPAICGGTGHRLGQLDHYGFRVPSGVVIPASWRNELLHEVPQHLLAAVRSISAGAVFSDRSGETWSGVGAAPGRGTARVIHHPNQGDALKAGEALVAPSTDPGWTPLFLRASTIVMESGYLSHSAIVALEYWIPAVVNIPGILSELSPGDTIIADGDPGRVIRDAEGVAR